MQKKRIFAFMKTAGRIILWTTCTILFLLTALSIIVPVILSPKRLTPIINNYAGRIPGADIRVSRASVSLFRHFPHATIVLDSGEVIVPSFRDIYPGADSLFVFDRLEAALLPIPLLKGSVSISYLILSHASLNLFRSRDCLSNRNLFNSNPDDTSSIDFWLDIKKLHINDGSEFTFHNAADTVYYNTRITDMMLTARHFSSLFDTRLETTSNTLVVGQTSFFNDIPFNVYGRTGFGIKPQKGNVSLDFEEYLFDECHTILGNVPVFIDGFMGLRDDSLDLRARCRVDSCNMSDLLNVIPGDLVPLKTELVADMPLTLDIVLDGAYYYGQGNIPAFSAALAAGSGTLTYLPEEDLSFRGFNADMSISYDPRINNYGFIAIRDLFVDSPAVTARIKGTVVSLFEDPVFDLSVAGLVVLDHLPLKATGDLELDVQARCKLSHLDLLGIGNASLTGYLATQGLTINRPADSIFCMAGPTQINLGIDPGEKLYATMVSDTLNVSYKQLFSARLSETQVSAQSVPGMFTKDTSRVQPLSGQLTSRSLILTLPDSASLRLGMCNASFSVNPREMEPSIPVIDLTLDTRSISGRYGVHRARINQADINLVLTKNIRSRTRSSSNRTGGVRTQLDDFSRADIDFDLDRDTRRLIRQWSMEGHLKASHLSVRTPFYPLRIGLQDVNLKFGPDRIDILNTSVSSGYSDLLLNGYVTNLRRVLAGRGKLGMFLDLQSDTLDCNQIIMAANAGSAFMKDSLFFSESEAVIDSLLTRQLEMHDSDNQLIIVPGNVNLQIVLAVSNAYFRNLSMTNLHGMLRAADRVLQIDQLKGLSNAGNITLDALYATPDKNNIRVGLDMELEDMRLEEVVKMLPPMDTIFPMLKSFEGLANVQVTAASALDTNMNIVLSELKAACRLRGKDLVLLDGETFTEISQKLLFRKKARNKIDRISVDITVEDSRIDIYPFIMEMDRYKAAVSGTHKLDMNFNYHISVLRSPIPFRLGVDVTGTLDDYRIKIGKCLYTNENIPSFSYKIDSVRLNLRDIITGHFTQYSFE